MPQCFYIHFSIRRYSITIMYHCISCVNTNLFKALYQKWTLQYHESTIWGSSCLLAHRCSPWQTRPNVTVFATGALTATSCNLLLQLSDPMSVRQALPWWVFKGHSPPHHISITLRSAHWYRNLNLVAAWSQNPIYSYESCLFVHEARIAQHPGYWSSMLWSPQTCARVTSSNRAG